MTVGAVLDLMRQLFDYVIVDCGDHVDENERRRLGAFRLSLLRAQSVDRGGAISMAIH